MFQHVCLHQSTSLPSPNCCRSVGPLGPLPSSSQFPTINLLSIRPAWARRNFRHISRKIMKTTTTKKIKLGSWKNQTTQHKRETHKPTEQTRIARDRVVRVRVVSWCCQAGKAKPCERCMHACIWGRETFLLFLFFSPIVRKKTSFVQSLGGAFFVEKQQSEERRSRES